MPYLLLPLFLFLLLFQLFHYLLSARFKNLHSSMLERARHDSSFAASQVRDDEEHMRTAIHQRRLTDASGEFVVVPHVVRHETRLESENVNQDVGLVSQCSLSQLHFISFLSKRWAGPVSVAVFAMPEELPLLVPLLAVMRQCQPHVQRRVRFHIVFPIGGSSNSSRSHVPSNCQEADRFLENLKIRARNYGEQKIAYPNNLLRNIARRYSGTEFTFVTDIDMVPNEGLRNSFLSFAARAGLSHSQDEQKVVYVVPVYEIPEGVSVPRNKKDLLAMVEKQEARPFYLELCWKCQKVTGYAAWEQSRPSSTAAPISGEGPENQDHEDQLSVLHTVGWKDAWEPFYISRNDVPFYDERFRQYGFNRVSQVCETHVAGYDFAVLNNAFLVHRGWKSSTSFHADKELDQERNRILFRQFKSSLRSKYPTGTRSCS